MEMTLRIALAWVLYGLGDAVSRMPRYPYSVYRWLMLTSCDLQGPSGRGPWSEELPS
jgi:hypothetical protein